MSQAKEVRNVDKVKKVLEICQLLLKTCDDFRNLADSVQAVCKAVMEGLSEEAPEQIEEKTAPKAEPAVTIEQVRGAMARKSEEGFTAEIKAIIRKHGADRLSAVDPKEYKAMIAEAEELGNG